MKSLPISTDKAEQQVQNEQGRAIARGIAEEQARKERNKASAVKRQATMLERAAERALSGKA